jgi:hypothetical protein
MPENTDWTGIPKTDPEAKPVEWRLEQSNRVIHIADGFIRGATVSGHFRLAEVSEPIRETPSGKLRAQVECLWYGRKPPNTWMHITLQGHYEYHRGECRVVTNVARRKRHD